MIMMKLRGAPTENYRVQIHRLLPRKGGQALGTGLSPIRSPKGGLRRREEVTPHGC